MGIDFFFSKGGTFSIFLKGGTISFLSEAAKTAFILCKDEVLKLLNERTKQAIIDSCGDLETWIKAKIESEVREQKVFGNILT